MKKLVRIKKELNLYNIEGIVCHIYGINYSDQDGRIDFSEGLGEQLYFIQSINEGTRYFSINIISISEDDTEFFIEEVEFIENIQS